MDGPKELVSGIVFISAGCLLSIFSAGLQDTEIVTTHPAFPQGFLLQGDHRSKERSSSHIAISAVIAMGSIYLCAHNDGRLYCVACPPSILVVLHFM
jgi:hypothetical protein